MTDTSSNVAEAARTFTQQTSEWITDNSAEIGMALLAGIVIALILLALRAFGHRLIRDRGADVHWRTIFGRALAKTSFFFIVMASARLVVGHADAPAILHRAISVLFVIAASLQAAIWGRELILGFIYQRVGEEEEQSTLGSAIGIIRLLVSVALFAIAVILILSNLGVNVTGLVAGLGIGGIAIGLAAQGIFSDLFAALSIIFDKPFRKGDTITFGATTGTVEQIGLKSTRIRSLGGEEVVISNTNLLNMQLQNWALLEHRRAVMTFGVTYQTPPETLARIGLEAKEIVQAQPLGRFDRCHAFQFGPSSIDFELVFFVESAAFLDLASTRQAVILGLMRRFGELGIDFAYPAQIEYQAGPDGKIVDPRQPTPAISST
jgi:small-conductance mechanosensitive channel